MSYTLPLRFPAALALVRRRLLECGLETAFEWDAALDVRDAMGPQLVDLRCIYVFDPVQLLRCANGGGPTAALTSITLCAAGESTTVTIAGQGTAMRKASGALSLLRHAA